MDSYQVTITVEKKKGEAKQSHTTTGEFTEKKMFKLLKIFDESKKK